MKKPAQKTGSFNTLTLTGLSILWGVMLGLINPWFMLLGGVTLLAGLGTELRDVYER